MGCLLLVAATSDPRLDIQRQGNQITVSISNGPPGSVMEAATNLTLPSPWQETIALSNNQLSLTLDATGAARFFRLRGPSEFDLPNLAPPLNESSFPDVASATEFLYSGTNAIQTGVTNGAIQPARASVLRGRVLQRDGSALTGVRVAVLDHPEFGQTFSRADGHYDLAVNGGFELRVNFEKSTYLPAQRSALVLAQDYNSLPDLILLHLDPLVTDVAFGNNSPGAIARGSTQTDSSGARTATLLVPPGIRASLVLPNGTTQEVSSLRLRATEYTVGSNGPAAMPAALPPSSGYTYAVELSADEAINAGAKSVTFNQDIAYYVENFIGFPVGASVPSAFYDRERAAWIPTPDGKVIRVVSVLNNLVEVDTDGDGLADVDQGASLGITTLERQRLATLYAAGQTLWRVSIRHFSPYDLNYGISPKPGAIPPRQPEPQSATPKVEDPTQAEGYGVVDIENQVLREGVPIVGTPFSLEYRSDQAGGDPAASQLLIQLSGSNVPPVLKEIRLTIEVAGRTFTQIFPPAPNQSHPFTWDRRDAYGRTVQGQRTARVRLDYIYDAFYNLPPALAASFGSASGQMFVPLVAARDGIRLSQSFSQKLGSLSRKSHGMGGWGLSAHHIYDPNGRVLFLGNGEQRRAESINHAVVKRFAGTDRTGQPVGDGGPAIDANIGFPNEMAFGPDGSLYIADIPASRLRRVTPDGIIHSVVISAGRPTGVAVAPDGSIYIAEADNNRVIRIAPSGSITTVAGTGAVYDPNDPPDDGGLATQAKISPVSLAVTPDGTLYFTEVDANHIRRVGPDGIITTFAGKRGFGFSGDGGPADQAEFRTPHRMAVGPDGSVYVADLNNFRVRRVTPDGIITTFAGGGSRLLADGVPATELATGRVRALDVAPDGTVFFATDTITNLNHLIYRVTTDGFAHRYAGGGSDGTTDNLPARQVKFEPIFDLTVGPDGALYTGEDAFTYPSGASRQSYVRRVASALPGFIGTDILLASADASEVYVFDQNGRHQRTVLALTGATLLEFHYDGAGRLNSVQDGAGLVTTIERDATGNPTAVVAPFGQRTTLTLNANGYLASVTNPAGEATQLGYLNEGLLASVTGPKGDQYTFSYDALGRLIRADDPAGGSTRLVPTNIPNGREVQAASALGRVSRYRVETLTNGVQRRVTIYPDGTQMESLRGADNGTLTTTLASGTVISSVFGPDPRFGMQAPILTSQSVRTPAGLTNTLRTIRAATLLIPDNPFSLSNLTDTVEINGRTNTLSYSGSNRTFIATSPEGRSDTNQIDALGRVLASQLAGLHPTRLSYDALGRATNIVTGSGADLRSARFSFDSAGRLQNAVNALNQSFGFAYDAADRLTQQHLPGARTIGFGYDLNGRITSVTPPGRPAHRFTNNIVNQLVSYTPPDVDGATHPERYQYNSDRDFTNVVRADGLAIAFTYDGGGRLNGAAYPNLDTLNFSYHPTSGLLAGITSADGISLALARDGALLTSQTWSGAIIGSVGFQYDSDFRLITQLVNGGDPISFGYDRDKLLTNAGALRLTYQPQNALLSTTTLDAVTDTRSYSAFGELTNYTATFNSAPLYAYALKFNALGRITNKTETIAGQTVTYDYAYDIANQLSEVRTNGLLAAAYTYDLNGNRLQRTNGLQAAAYSYDDRDRLRQRTVGAELTQFAYTPNGELRTQTVAGSITTYTYDPRGNLRQVGLPNATQIEYLVDGASRRIGKKVNGTLVKGFLYQGALTPIAELDGNNTVVSRFIYGTRVNVPEYMIRGSVTYRILCDHLGSVRLVINAADGVIAQRIDYDEFGVVLADTNPGFQPFGFAGGLHDSDTGLVRFGARDYDARTGQWTDRDPILFAGQQTSLYAYVGNDPINAVDPGGTGPHLAGVNAGDVVGKVRGGKLFVRRPGASKWVVTKAGDAVRAGDELRAPENAGGSIEFTIGGRATINPGSTARVATERSVENLTPPSLKQNIKGAWDLSPGGAISPRDDSGSIAPTFIGIKG